MKINFIEENNKFKVYMGTIDQNDYTEKIKEISERLNIKRSKFIEMICKHNACIMGFMSPEPLFHTFHFTNLNNLNNFLIEIEPILITANLEG